MAVELQLNTATLVALVERRIQGVLRTTCSAPIGTTFVDHFDVVSGATALTDAGNAIELRVPVDIFVVTRGAVLSSPNATPVGANTPAGRLAVVLQLGVSDTDILLTCTDVEFDAALNSALGSAAGTARQEMQDRIGVFGSLAAGPMLTSVGVPNVESSRVERVGGSVLVRFDPVGPAIEVLLPGQDWGVFIDAQSMEALANAQIDPALQEIRRSLTSSTVIRKWAPAGTKPRVEVDFDGKAAVPDPFSVNLHYDIDIDFLLLPVIGGKSLELLVTWGVKIDLGALVPRFVEEGFEASADAAFDPASLGAQPVGDHQFALSRSLPKLSFGGAEFVYQSITGLPSGMVLGGNVALPAEPGRTTVTIDIVPFTELRYFVNCSDAQNNIKRSPTPDVVSTSARVQFGHVGAVCGFEIVSPTGFNIIPYLTAPAPGTNGEDASISMNLPATIAAVLATNPRAVQLLVRTTRGVSLVDFGTPPKPEFNDSGEVSNAEAIRINDCHSVGNDPWFINFRRFNPKWHVDPSPIWHSQLDRVVRFGSSLVKISGLQPGELITFDTPIDGLRAVFSADLKGRAIVPLALPLRAYDEGAVLARASRHPMREVEVKTVNFEQVAVLDTTGAIAHKLSGDERHAVIVSTYADRVEAVEIDRMAIPRRVMTEKRVITEKSGTAGYGRWHHGEIAFDDGPTKPNSAVLRVKIDLPGLLGIHAVPGFEDEAVAVGTLNDGSHVLLVTDVDGSIRVGGLMSAGPLIVPTASVWAISAPAGDRVAVFVLRKA